MIGNALNAYGKFQASVGLAIALCICMSLTSSGTVALRRKPQFTQSTTGTVKNVMCSSNTCTASVTVTFRETTKVDDETRLKVTTHNPEGLVYPAPLTTGSNVTVYYTSDTFPKFASSTDVVPKWIGPSLIATGVCILLFAATIAYWVFSSRGVSQVTGGLGIVDVLGR